MIATAEKVIPAKDTDIKKRILEVMESSGKNKSEYARNMGVTPNYLAAVLTNPTKGVSATLFKGLAEMGVNVNWLVTGKGDPLTGNGESFQMRAEKAEARNADLERDLERAHAIGEELKILWKSEIKKSIEAEIEYRKFNA
jgi:transcriptional regulator with XRE-family HTH domain